MRPFLILLFTLAACGPAEWYEAVDGGELLWSPEPGRAEPTDPDGGAWVCNPTDEPLECQVVTIGGRTIEVGTVAAGGELLLLDEPCELAEGDATAVCWRDVDPVGVAAWRFACG